VYKATSRTYGCNEIMALLIPAWSFFKAKLILPVLNICNAETVA